MRSNQKKFDLNDRLTAELLLGNFSEGDIPRFVRRRNETHGATLRRRVLVLHQINKYPRDAKEAKKSVQKLHDGLNKLHEEAITLNKLRGEFDNLYDEAVMINAEFDAKRQRTDQHPVSAIAVGLLQTTGALSI